MLALECGAPPGGRRKAIYRVGRAAPDALRGRRPSKLGLGEMVGSTLKLNASISDFKIGGLRIMSAEDQKWGGPGSMVSKIQFLAMNL